MEEINEVIPLNITKPKFVYKFHEDKQSCIKMATGTTFSSIKKHIALKYHNFRTHAKSRRVEIQYIQTNEQLADILTKNCQTRISLRFVICSMNRYIILINTYPISNTFCFSKMDALSRGSVIILS